MLSAAPAVIWPDRPHLPPAAWVALAVAAALLAALLGWALWRAQFDFVITARPGGEVRSRGRFPPGRRETVADFLRGVAAAGHGRVTVRGTWMAGGRLRLWISGPASRGQAQRIRTFFMVTLRP